MTNFMVLSCEVGGEAAGCAGIVMPVTVVDPSGSCGLLVMGGRLGLRQRRGHRARSGLGGPFGPAPPAGVLLSGHGRPTGSTDAGVVAVAHGQRSFGSRG